MNDRPLLRILLVEDDTGVGRMLQRGLAGEGFAVDWSRNLGEAARALAGGRFDLIVLDRMLPDGDGADLCAELGADRAATGVLMLTARDSLEEKLAGYTAGADDYLTKPFEFDELLARLTALARRVAPATRLDLRLDPNARSLLVGEETVRFTKREWPLFQYLFDRCGQAISRADLIRNVWGGDGAVTENNVDVYVGYVRRKLAGADAPLRIEAVRGVGYTLMC